MKKSAPPSVRIPELIARDLGVKIVSGTLRPGALLDGEIEASDQRSVSRSAYREAVRILVAKGLVQSKPKAGTIVKDRSAWHLLDPDVLSWIFQIEPDHALVFGLFELRRMVEPDAAALAALRRTPRQLKDMAEGLEGMRHGRPMDKKWREADEKFHTALFEASGNDVLMSLTASINAAITWSTIFKQRHEPIKRDPMLDHEKVYRAIEKSDPAAAYAAMAELVDLALFDMTNAPRWQRAIAPEPRWQRTVSAFEVPSTGSKKAKRTKRR